MKKYLIAIVIIAVLLHKNIITWWNIISLLLIIIVITILWFAYKANQFKRKYAPAIEATVAVVNLIIVTIDEIRAELRRRIATKHLNAMKGVILKAKKNSVDVGIFNSNNQQIAVETMDFGSNHEVRGVKTGKEIYL